MTESNKIEQLIIDAMKKLNAVKEANAKPVKDLATKANRPKMLIINNLSIMAKKKIVGRKIINNSACYFLIN